MVSTDNLKDTYKFVVKEYKKQLKAQCNRRQFEHSDFIETYFGAYPEDEKRILYKRFKSFLDGNSFANGFNPPFFFMERLKAYYTLKTGQIRPSTITPEIDKQMTTQNVRTTF